MTDLDTMIAARDSLLETIKWADRVILCGDNLSKERAEAEKADAEAVLQMVLPHIASLRQKNAERYARARTWLLRCVVAVAVSGLVVLAL